MVLGVLADELSHRATEGFAAVVFLLSGMRIELTQGLEITALAAGVGMQLFPSLDLISAFLALGCIRGVSAPLAFGNAPVSHGATRIFSEHLAKCLLCSVERKRVEQPDSELEVFFEPLARTTRGSARCPVAVRPVRGVDGRRRRCKVQQASAR